MNLITRTIPILVLGLSGLTLSTASLADSSFNIVFSSGYTIPQVNHAYYNSYRPYARPHRPPVHVDTYVEKHVYRNKGYYGRYRDDEDRYEDNERYNEYGKHRRGGHYSRGYADDSHARRRHTSYARISHY